MAQSLLLRLMVGRLLVGFVWLNLLFTVQCFISGVRVAQSIFYCSVLLVGFVCSIYCLLYSVLFVGFVLLNLLFTV